MYPGYGIKRPCTFLKVLYVTIENGSHGILDFLSTCLFHALFFPFKIHMNMYEEPQADGQIKLFPVLFFKFLSPIIVLILVTSDHIPAFA